MDGSEGFGSVAVHVNVRVLVLVNEGGLSRQKDLARDDFGFLPNLGGAPGLKIVHAYVHVHAHEHQRKAEPRNMTRPIGPGCHRAV